MERDQRHEVLRRMDELGCEPSLRALVADLPRDVEVVVNDGVGHFLPLAGAPGAVAALYMNVRHCHVALDPGDAARLAEATGGRLLARARRTHRVRITAEMADNPALKDLVLEATARALLRSAAGRPPVPAVAADVDLDLPCVVLRVSRAWREGMDADEVYDVTRGWWVLGPQREQAEYAVAVAKGRVRGVFQVHGWRPRHLADDGGPGQGTRWGFDGEPSLEHEHLVGLDVSHLFPPGAANPVRYLNLPDAQPAPPAMSWEADRPSSVRRSSALAELCAQLRDNPVLHLSLTSKELFHSNLLGWLFERSPDVAEAVLGPHLVAEPGCRTHLVQREHHHLDLVVHLPGRRPLVIENKVFSLPDEEQLDGYAASNIPAAGLGGATKALLSLTDPGWPHDRYGGWTWLSYEDVAARLLPAVEQHLPDDTFTRQLVEHWTAMVEVLLRLAELTAPEPQQPLALDADAVELLRTVRLHDVVQKLRTRKVRHLLEQHLEGAGTVVDDLESSFTKGTPLLTGRLLLDDGAQIGWQLQGSQWRRFLIVPEHLKGRSEASKQARIAYAQAHHDAWFDFTPEQAYGPFAPSPDNDFKHFAPGFLYDYVRVPGVTVAMVLALAQVVLTEAARYREAWTVPADA